MTDDAIEEVLRVQYSNSKNTAMSDEMFLVALTVAVDVVSARLTKDGDET